MKKLILLSLIITLFGFGLVYVKNFETNEIDSINNFDGCTNNGFLDERIGMANPAAVYCHELGYDYKIVETDRGQEGICILPDKECDGWRFLEGKCGQEYSYCARQGYDLIIKTDGMNPFTREYAVCVRNRKEIGSATELFSLSEKATRGFVSVEENSAPEGSISTESFVPLYLDWRNEEGQNWMTSVKDQGNCGSCWAFSAVGTTEAIYNIFENDPSIDLDLSEEFLVTDCVTTVGSCCGGWPSAAFGYIKDNGIPDEACFVYGDDYCSCFDTGTCTCTYSGTDICSDFTCSDRCPDWDTRLTNITDYGFVSNDRSDIKEAIYKIGPLSASMGIGDSFGGDWDEDIYRCEIDDGANHAIILAGYNDYGEYWVVKNSWGADWNDDGYFKVGYGECAIENNVRGAVEQHCADGVWQRQEWCGRDSYVTIGGGDMNHDCIVDIWDYGLLASMNNSNNPSGDFNDDNIVDSDDFVIWNETWGDMLVECEPQGYNYQALGALAVSFNADPNLIVNSLNATSGSEINVYVVALGVFDMSALEFGLESGPGLHYKGFYAPLGTNYLIRSEGEGNIDIALQTQESGFVTVGYAVYTVGSGIGSLPINIIQDSKFGKTDWMADLNRPPGVDKPNRYDFYEVWNASVRLDSDGDGVFDHQDNCWFVNNTDQKDTWGETCPPPPYLTNPKCGDACERRGGGGICWECMFHMPLTW